MAQNWKKKATELALQLVDYERAVGHLKEQVAHRDGIIDGRDRRIEDYLARLAIGANDLERSQTALKREGERLERERISHRITVTRLKAELAAALENLARYQGYVDRTLDDDRVREVPAVIERAQEPEHKRRGPPPLLRVAHAFDEVASRATVGNYEARREEKPWFDL